MDGSTSSNNGQHAVRIDSSTRIVGSGASSAMTFRMLTGGYFEDGTSYRLYVTAFRDVLSARKGKPVSLKPGDPIALCAPDGRVMREGHIQKF